MPDPVPLRRDDPTRIGGHELTARLGEGGQGVVYLGRSPSGAAVAVKVLRADLPRDQAARDRFVREVSAAARVATFCTAQVIETGVDEHGPFIVSEYIDGPTLAAAVGRDGPRTGAALLRLAVGTVTALVAIHRAGIVHRDFKPANVLLGADGPRVIDFGVAKALDATTTLTSAVTGTPAYLTPEQLSGEPAGPAADMFAWAGTMLFAATGRAPFGADGLPAVFHRIMTAEPDLTALEEPLRGVVAACLAKAPSARPSAGQVLMRLLGEEAQDTGGAEGERAPEGSAPDVLEQDRDAPAGRPSSGDGAGREVSPGDVPVREIPARKGKAHRRRVPVLAAGTAVLVLAGAGYLTAQVAAGQGRGPGPRVTSSGSPAASSGSAAVPSGVAVAPATRAYTLPGSAITVHEGDGDPIRLTSYGLGDGARVYVRAGLTGRFTPATGYLAYAMSPGGRRALGIDALYGADGSSTVSVVDRPGGPAATIAIARAPVYPAFPQWSPDGTRALVTLNEATGGTAKGYGYAIIDPARKKARVVRVRDSGVGRWSYFWRGDGRAVGTWASGAGEVRWYALDGAAAGTLPGLGGPLTVDGEDLSPSGLHFLSRCPGAAGEICVWTADGRPSARFAFPADRVIGWYDETRIAAWRRKGEGYEAVVVDLGGRVSRVLATAGAAEYKATVLRYTRTG
ncbi:hypothetical protein Sme01_01240 [Sphaerisporangium melleum]|uniref:Protein kinase domain-containing protein n=1 Tax=Sphaerisporangium melleum TaxID=321316 RepID=A0A917VIM9_9ACTN|nr:serine/threonine-protein kinase [Sphaerisporangium melleum]GGK88241.1 hypothetical protein GCM10007964_33570 [Sphaerisporangium melleum]GII67648.1 hypothetical protein Sme01_01240 [Sphaerisporangium melleum]